MRTVCVTSMYPGSQGEWAGMHVCVQWWLHCTSQWGWQVPWTEHVYCVAVSFKMTEWVEQWICIRFYIKLEHSSAETVRLIQKSAAMGNWWLAASSRQRAHSHITCRAECSWNIKSPRWLRPLQPEFGALWLLAFSKTEITFEREEISDHQWNSGQYGGAVDGDWENYVRFQGVCFEGHWGVIVLCTMFLVSCIFSFSYLMAGYLLDRSRVFLLSHRTLRCCLFLKVTFIFVLQFG